MAATFPGVCAVVPAAGFGRRMQTECPKQYLSIGNKTILEHAVAALLADARVQRVVIAVSPGDRRFSQLPLAQHPPCLGHGRGQADRLSPVRQAGLGRILSAGQEAAQGLMCRTYRKQLAGATQSLPSAISTPHNFKRGLFNGPRFSLRTNRADCAQMSMRFALLSTVNRALLRTERVFCHFCGLVR